MKGQEKKSVWSWIIFFSLVLIWGSAFLLIKKGLTFYSPAQVAGFRIFIGFITLLPLSISMIRKNKFTKQQWKGFMFVGFCGSLIPAFLFALAQTNINSSTAGILSALTPVFTLIISFFAFKQYFTRNSIIGLVLGFSGTVSLVFLTKAGTIDFSNFYGLLILGATFCYALNANFIKFNLQTTEAMHIACLSLSITGPLTGIYLLTTDFVEISLQPEAFYSLGAITILGLTSTAAGLVLFNHLIKHTTPLFANSVTYMMPLVALLWGALDNEPLNYFHFIGMIFIITGIFLINKK